MITGVVVSTTVTVWLQNARLLQQSVTDQVRIHVCGQAPLVTVLTTLIVTFVPQQASRAVGVSKVQGVPHSTTLFDGQLMTGGVVSDTVMVWLQVLVLPQQSVANQTRV